MAETINYGLYVEDDSSTLFKDWRAKMNSSADDSNIVKIDRILKEIAEAGVVDITTEESDASGGENKITFTLANGKVVDFTVRNGTDGIADIYIGDGDMPDDCRLQILPSGGNTVAPTVGDGGYYTPTVSQVDANTIKISFRANLDGMNEVSDQIITIPSGESGTDGDDGFSPTITVEQTDDGSTITITDKNGSNTVVIKNGEDGQDGVPGTSCTHSWDGTVLTIKSASGETSVDLKGQDGEDGYTPQKGIDYWTESDKDEIKNYVDTLILGGEW